MACKGGTGPPGSEAPSGAVAAPPAPLIVVEVEGRTVEEARTTVWLLSRAGAAEVLFRLNPGQGVIADAAPACSPDGQRLAFGLAPVSPRAARLELLLFDRGTGRLRRLAPGLFVARTPSWAPEGELIAFAGRRGREGPNALWLVTPEGDAPRQLSTPKEPGGDQWPLWLADGRLAFLGWGTLAGELRLGVWTVEAPAPEGSPEDSSAPRFLSPLLLPPVLLSPDGTRFALVSRNQESAQSDVAVSDLGGDNVRFITATPDLEGAPRWSADSAWLLFLRTPLRGEGEPAEVQVVVAASGAGAAEEARLVWASPRVQYAGWCGG